MCTHMADVSGLRLEIAPYVAGACPECHHRYGHRTKYSDCPQSIASDLDFFRLPSWVGATPHRWCIVSERASNLRLEAQLGLDISKLLVWSLVLPIILHWVEGDRLFFSRYK